MSVIKENSPFTPGNPVPVELFVGRIKQIKEILKYAKQSTYGSLENVFLVGERGIGKSSLAGVLCNDWAPKENFLSVYVSLGGVENLNEFIRRIFEQILKEVNIEKSLRGKFSDFLKEKAKYIKVVDLFGFSLGFSFNPPEEDLQNMLRNFPEAIKGIIEKIKDKKDGIFIALDDINGLSRELGFANWYKSFVDNASIRYAKAFPVFIMPIGIPEIRDVLSKEQPSLMRIFRVIRVEKLSDEEVREFFQKAFNKVSVEVKKEAMDFMVMFSSGLPILMHEIGDAVFWKDKDEIIDKKDTIEGIKDAAKNIGEKYLEPKVYRAIQSDRYKSILRKLGEEPTITFTKREIESKLTDKEKKVFNNFLRKMRDLGVITPDIERGRGSYKFVNMLYPVYIWMESQTHFKKK